ncbi:MAG: hypothetical protein Q7R54_00335 [bacterium]|nr:hypothetical protein [bacterium]
MPIEDGELPAGPLSHRPVAHYHGDTVRTLFVVAAVVMLMAETTGASLPLTTFQIVSLAVLLVVAAGITNPAQEWIHFVNALLAIFGAIIFGLYAIEQYRTTLNVLAPTFLYAEILALLFLVTVYYATKTARGILLRPHFR